MAEHVAQKINNEEEGEEEEDWSSMMAATEQTGTGEASSGFASYERKTIRISETFTLELNCVSALSPLDMMDMYHGVHDATGHKVWMGALLFVEAFARHLPAEELLNDEKVRRTRVLLMDLRSRVFREKRVLELGCGTGAAGLSILKSGKNRPSSLTFTDSDPAALALCKSNCRINLDLDRNIGYQYDVCELTWGEQLLSSDGTGAASCSQLLTPESYDTVFATDVLYDISSLSPLVRTASKLLKPGGYFILSHVPRASIDGGNGGESSVVASAKVLEEMISQEGLRAGLNRCGLMAIRPRELGHVWGQEPLCADTCYTDMSDVGAAILVFLKE